MKDTNEFLMMVFACEFDASTDSKELSLENTQSWTVRVSANMVPSTDVTYQVWGSNGSLFTQADAVALATANGANPSYMDNFTGESEGQDWFLITEKTATVAELTAGGAGSAVSESGYGYKKLKVAYTNGPTDANLYITFVAAVTNLPR